jgi:hypothetical protein
MYLAHPCPGCKRQQSMVTNRYGISIFILAAELESGDRHHEHHGRPHLMPGCLGAWTGIPRRSRNGQLETGQRTYYVVVDEWMHAERKGGC